MARLPRLRLSMKSGLPGRRSPTAADPWLDAVTTETFLAEATRDGKPTGFSIGSRLLRMIYHYWFHTGENAAIRQNLGHVNLPDFVGNIEDEAPYRPE